LCHQPSNASRFNDSCWSAQESRHGVKRPLPPLALRQRNKSQSDAASQVKCRQAQSSQVSKCGDRLDFNSRLGASNCPAHIPQHIRHQWLPSSQVPGHCPQSSRRWWLNFSVFRSTQHPAFVSSPRSYKHFSLPPTSSAFPWKMATSTCSVYGDACLMLC
jgi:hypothetical protein